MPNFKLSHAVRDEIAGYTDKVLLDRVRTDETRFPLTVAGFQAAIMRPDHLSSLRELESEGMMGLPKSTSVVLGLLQDYLPGLERACVVEFNLPESVFVPQSPYFYGTAVQTWRDSYEREYFKIRLNLGVLDEEDNKLIVEWANRAVRARRLYKMAQRTRDEFLAKCKTTGDILNNFPILANFVKDEFWRGRFRSPPARLYSYAVDYDRKRLAATEVVLLGAEALPEFVPDATQVMAEVKAWRPLPNDPSST